MKKFLPYYLVTYLVVLMMIYPQDSILYARQAMNLCYEIIVPSLFPFFVCSGLLIYSGFSEKLSHLCRPIMKPLFNVNGCGAAALVLGTISGYPLGAVTACQLYDASYLSKSETERLLAFCNNSGPLFILGAVGTAVYNSPKIGIMLYCAHIAAALTVGIIFRFYAKEKHSAPDFEITQPELTFPEVFSNVLSNSISSILTVCGAVIFFSVISNIIVSQLPSRGILRTLIIGISELTNGVKSISELPVTLFNKLVMSAFVVGFAGICVHLQVMAVAAQRQLTLKPYIVGKILHGFIAAAYTMILFKLFPVTESAFKNNAPKMPAGFCMSSLYSVISIIFFAVLAWLFIFFGRAFAKNKKVSCKINAL
ncbi:MAG: hypothetical protein PUB42_07415 [Firmicutes bacterium]|nr:hypothetical protein [Bacillota bacterium]